MLSREVVATLGKRIEAADEWQLQLLTWFERRATNLTIRQEVQKLSQFLVSAGMPQVSEKVQVIPDLLQEGAWGSADLFEALTIVQQVRYDAARMLEESLGPPASLDQDLRFNIPTAVPHQSASREQWAAALRNFIYDAPGLFMAEIHRQLSDRGYPHSYSALTDRIRELELGKQILTIGFRQGVKRYCFPHPDQIQRQAVYGRDMAFRGEIKSNVTDRFVETKAPYDVYVLNTHMKPLLILAPFASQLRKDEAFEGFGPVTSTEELATTYGLHTASLPKGVHDVVRPRQLFALESAESLDSERKPIALPPNYVV